VKAIAEIAAAGSHATQRYSLREAARILELPGARLRALARAGFLAPQRGPIGPLSFGFRDLLLLRTTRGLLESGVSMRRIRRIWASLRDQLSANLPLTGITISTDGEDVVASDGSARWSADSGQTLLNFEASEIAERAGEAAGFGRLGIVAGTGPRTPLPDSLRREDARDDRVRLLDTEPAGHGLDSADLTPTADEWYETGCDLEDSSAERAREAYERALELDPDLAEAHVNLGRLLHVAGERGRAEPHYREAVKLDPDDPTPHFNLGVLLEEQGRRDEAVHAYRQAILRDPDFADAHCNLGLLLESFGRAQEAMRHLMAARKLNGTQE